MSEPSGTGKASKGFDAIASKVAAKTGHASAFTLAVLVVLVWALAGPVFGFSDTWQLVINTGTTVLTFLMVFVLQNTLNRDSKALHVKLDELIRTSTEARDALIGAEDEAERDLDAKLADEEQRAKEPSSAG